MLAKPIKIQLSWQDPTTREKQQPILDLPVAIGRELNEMPESLGHKTVSRVVLDSKKVSRFHALITYDSHQLLIADRSANGTFVDNQYLHQASLPLKNKDTINIGSYKIAIALMKSDDPNATETNTQTTTTHLNQRSTFWHHPGAIAVIGGTLVLLTGIASWALVSTLLEQYRPQTPEIPVPSEVQP